MRIIRNLPLVLMLVCCFPLHLAAAPLLPAPEWDAVLDGIQAHTWRGRADLSAELSKEEARIKQALPDYIAAWEQRMAAPIIYTGKGRTGDTCSPLGYCASDFLDPVQLAVKLRERKEPVARFLFSKLSPEAQRTLAGLNSSSSPDAEPAKAGTVKADSAPAAEPAGAVSQLLAGELTRIVREDSLYDAERFSGVLLSPAAMALINEHNNVQNRFCANKTLLAEAYPAELARNFKCVIEKDEAYRRVVAAQTVQHLRTGDKKALDRAIEVSQNFENKLIYTDFAFWYYYPRSLADIQARDSAALNYDGYALLNGVILWLEPLEAGKPAPPDRERRHYAWNLADLLLKRAIIEGKMEGLEALGTAVWLLQYHNVAQPAGEREQELMRLIVDVRNFLSGPESDNFRLNYAVAMREGQRQLTLLMRALDANQKGPSVEKLFNDARENFRLACEWAGTGQGRARALSSYLELTNMALARMKDLLPPATYASLTVTKGKADADTAVALYREMIKRVHGGWEELRFNDRKDYVDSAQRLWNALRKNSILVGNYYMARIDKDDFQSVMDNSEPAEKAFIRYVKLFEACAAEGPLDIIPDSAYFAYAECFKKLSRIKRVIYSFNKNMELLTQSVDYLLKAITIYPYDDSISEYAAITKNINTGVINMLPDVVVGNIVANNTIAKCLEGNKYFCDDNTRQVLEWSIYKVRNRLYNDVEVNKTDEMKALAKRWKTEPRNPANTARLESQRIAVIKLAERYGDLSGELSALTASAVAQLNACSAAGTGAGCEDAGNARERLMAGREASEKMKNELAAACNAYKQMLGNSGISGGKDAEVITNLASLVNEVHIYQKNRILEVSIQKKLYDLQIADDDPMHKIVKSGYYVTQ